MDTRVFELRTYTAKPGKIDALHARFRDHTTALKMPMGARLNDAQIEDLVAWVKAGAVWPKAAMPTSASDGGRYTIAPERRTFWSLQPLSVRILHDGVDAG